MSDELIACWAALVAFVEDVHQPQFNLTEQQWSAALRIVKAIPYPAPTAEDHILALALWTMLDEFDAPDMDAEAWTIAERMLAEYTAKVEALR